jgi:alkylhydroperoxidase family enzyme
MRLRIAVLNGCVTCQSARLAAETVPEDQATGIWAEDFASNEDHSPAERAAVEFAERMAVAHHGMATPTSKRSMSTSTTARSSS